MPRPEKDYALALKRDIEKVTRSMQIHEQKRQKLINAYEAYTGESFPRALLTAAPVPEVLPTDRAHRKAPSKRRRAA